MQRYMHVPSVPEVDYNRYAVQMLDGTLPDQNARVKEAIRRLVVFCYSSYLDGPRNLDWVHTGKAPISEADLIKRMKAKPWKKLFAKAKKGPTKGKAVAFRGWLGECLAYWTARKLRPYIHVSRAKPNSTDPAFDLIAFEREGGKLVVRWIQAKATEGNLQGNSAAAIHNFSLLRKGEYPADVNYSLRAAYYETLEDQLGVTVDEIATLQLNENSWRYSVFLVHEGTPTGQLMTKYAEHIPGKKIRREAITMQFDGIEKLLKEMEDEILAHFPKKTGSTKRTGRTP